MLTDAGIELETPTTLAALKEHILDANISKDALRPYIHESQLYYVASRYLLPACLVLLTLCIDLREVFQLGPKALIMFLTGTFGVIIGGPLAILLSCIRRT